MPPSVAKPSVAPKTMNKVQSKNLFSDDEDSQVCFYYFYFPPVCVCVCEKFYHRVFLLHFFLPKIFPPVPKSQSKPEGPEQHKPSKATISIFDDDDEEEEEEVSVSISSSKI